MESFRVMLARFPGRGQEHPHVTDWCIDTAIAAVRDTRVQEFSKWWHIGTPVDVLRNAAVAEAKTRKAHILLMIDSDMQPDHENEQLPSLAAFWTSSFEFFCSHWSHGPCVIGIPYMQSYTQPAAYGLAKIGNGPETMYDLTHLSPAEAIRATGITEVPVVGTGLVMIDMRAFEPFVSRWSQERTELALPYFYYTYLDKARTKIKNTEDIVFCANAFEAGLPIYCNWDAWSVHWKYVAVCKPTFEELDKGGTQK